MRAGRRKVGRVRWGLPPPDPSDVSRGFAAALASDKKGAVTHVAAPFPCVHIPVKSRRHAGTVAMPNLANAFVHLGPGAAAVTQPAFTDGEWYRGYGERHDTDGAEGRLVSQWTFTENWDSWEMHPFGEEVVLCTAGAITLHQQFADGSVATVTLGPGEYAINPRSCWHTADITSSATAVFITAGFGTVGRPR